MNILLLGSGGREHALAWKILDSSMANKIYVLPGNDGMKMMLNVHCLEGKMDDHDFLIQTAMKHEIDLIIVGPEKPLAMGVVNSFKAKGIPVFGPSKEAARLESSKIFAKEFMKEFNIPTADCQYFDDIHKAFKAIEKWPWETIVVKADSLAAGKGVVLASTKKEAKEAVYDFMKNPACPVKTKRIILEQCLTGKEISSFALCDGENFLTLGHACDYKRVGEGDTGANTGGMGCLGLKDWPSSSVCEYIEKEIFAKVLYGMKKRGTPFCGVLFAGLMIDGMDVRVLEFNVRFGDPETQILMPLIKNDLLPYFYACTKGHLSLLPEIKFKDKTAIHVVMASKNYPAVDGTPLLTGSLIDYPSSLSPEEYLFFSGVKNTQLGLVNSGGRVLGVTVLGDDLKMARENVYARLNQISFNGAHYRSDIGG